MATVGVLTFSDGRDFVYRDLMGFACEVEDSLAAALEDAGHEVRRAEHVITSAELATSQARSIGARRPDLTVFNIPVWAFPHFAMLAAEAIEGPILLFSSLRPEHPGMVGMLAAGGALDQVGRRHGRAWGSIDEPGVLARVDRYVRAAHAVRALRGTTFGRVGGRPMGMYTAVANPDQWIATFGVDVEEIDQWEIVRRSERVEASRVRAGREWLERHAGAVHYDGRQLTPEKLERQIRSYHAMRELIDEWKLDFSGIKGQPELTTHFCTMDVTEAFLNDPYDWEGPKRPHVCATEADMDGALTMQLLKLIARTPVLFADLRHYHPDRDVWDLCNSGQHATWYAARSDDAAENLRHVELHPEGFFFPAGGASVRHIAAPGAMTFARLGRRDGRYRMQVLRGEFVRFGRQGDEDLARQSTFAWPHAFARIEADVETILSRYGSNHIHAVPGDHVAELRIACDLMGVDFEPLGAAA